jgi:hypothetical protein
MFKKRREKQKIEIDLSDNEIADKLTPKGKYFLQLAKKYTDASFEEIMSMVNAVFK